MPPPDKAVKELRLALGMRGGVSLAVWIGGACAEIDLLRKAGLEGATPPTPFWVSLLNDSCYTAVVVDVMAGASAGGLNGVLFAASQQYGFDLERLRSVWLTLGALNQLIRKKSPGAPSPSLLDGDRHFLTPLHDTLVSYVGPGPVPTGRPVIDLQLTATLVHPVILNAVTLRDEKLIKQRFAARFHFSYQGNVPWGSQDFPGDQGEDLHQALWRLATAGRATSSFPGAFEAAAVQSRRPFQYAPLTIDEPELDSPVNMWGVFSESGADPTKTSDNDAIADRHVPLDVVRDADLFAVSDGGILDNIPLDKALNAIAAAAADAPTERVLVYLQPGAPAAPKEDALGLKPRPPLTSDDFGPADPRRSTLSVAEGFLHTRLPAETITADIEQLEDYNRGVHLGYAIRRETFHSMAAAEQMTDGTPTAPLIALAQAAWLSYLPQRLGADAAQTRLLLDDPGARMGEDPFPSTAGDERWRAPLAAWTWPPDRVGLDAAILQVFATKFSAANEPITWAKANEPANSPILFDGVGPLMRMCRLLIDWARYVEGQGAASAGAKKELFYRVLLFAERVLDRYRRMAWVDSAVRDPPTGDVSEWVARASARANRLLLVTDDMAQGIADELLNPPSGTWTTIDAYINQVTEWLDEPSPAAPGTTDLRGPLFTALCDQATRLRAEHPYPPLPSVPNSSHDPGADQNAGADLHLALTTGLPNSGTGTDSNPSSVSLSALAALEVVCLPEYLSGRPGARPIDFVRLSAANRTPVAPLFTTLKETADALDLPSPPTDADGKINGINVKVKLAGNHLMNFSAFLNNVWRANDWMWGRLDAVPTLVDLLVTSDSLTRKWKGRVAAEIREALKALVETEELSPVVGPTPDVCGWKYYERRITTLAEALEAGGDLNPDDVNALRDALIARRQWAILHEELSRVPFPGAGTAELDVLKEVKAYDIGTQTVDRPRRQENAEVFRDLGHAAARTLRWNAESLTGGTVKPLGTIRRVVDGLAWLVDRVASTVPLLLLSPRRTVRRIIVALAMALALTLAVVALVFDLIARPVVHHPVGAGWVASIFVLLPAVVLAGWLWRKMG